MKAGGRIQEAKAGVRAVKGWEDPEALSVLIVLLSQDHCSCDPPASLLCYRITRDLY